MYVYVYYPCISTAYIPCELAISQRPTTQALKPVVLASLTNTQGILQSMWTLRGRLGINSPLILTFLFLSLSVRSPTVVEVLAVYLPTHPNYVHVYITYISVFTHIAGYLGFVIKTNFSFNLMLSFAKTCWRDNKTSFSFSKTRTLLSATYEHTKSVLHHSSHRSVCVFPCQYGVRMLLLVLGECVLNHRIPDTNHFHIEFFLILYYVKVHS